MCYKCCKPVHGHGAIEWFDMGMFGREVKRVLLCEDCGGVEVCAIPIGTRECKTKRKRPRHVSPPHQLTVLQLLQLQTLPSLTLLRLQLRLISMFITDAIECD
jgi:hypothetical protein